MGVVSILYVPDPTLALALMITALVGLVLSPEIATFIDDRLSPPPEVACLCAEHPGDNRLCPQHGCLCTIITEPNDGWPISYWDNANCRLHAVAPAFYGNGGHVIKDTYDWPT